MVKHYLKIAWRNLIRNKIYSAINVLGLGVGLSASIIIFLIVQYDYSFDKWEPHASEIYRLNAHRVEGDLFGVPVPAADAIKNTITGVTEVCRYKSFQGPDFQVKPLHGNSEPSRVFNNESGIVFTDEEYFRMFPHEWLRGQLTFAFARPNQVVLSLSIAKKYFPGLSIDEIMGKNIQYGDSTITTVTGIVADLREHTDIDKTAFISYSTFTSSKRWNYMVHDWNANYYGFNCFLRINKTANVAGIERQIRKLYAAHVRVKDPNFQFTAALQPLNQIHFGIPQNGELVFGRADKSVLRELIGLAVILLLLAVINFINLSTSHSTIRAKEIGVRKSLGGVKRQIVFQFLIETFVVALFASTLALLISPLVIRMFISFLPEGFGAGLLFQLSIIVFLFVVTTLVTVLAGLYPGFVLANFRPALVLKGQTANTERPGRGRLREILTIFQFVVAQVFLIIVIIVGKQVHYELNADVGARKDGIVYFNVPFISFDDKRQAVLIDELRKIPQIQNLTSYGSAEPYAEGNSRATFEFHGKKKTFTNLIAIKDGDSNYIKVFNISLLAGRTAHVDTTGNLREVLANASLTKEMGFEHPSDALGSVVNLYGLPKGYAVVGIMKDFNMQSLHLPVEPLVYMASNSIGGRIALLLDSNNISSWQVALNRTRKIFKQKYPERDFEYTFFDKATEDIYRSDIRLSTLLKWATGLAIFISCLGLLGLATFMAASRVKEIGIRKVLGATVSQILVLLSKNLLKLMLLAYVIGFSVAWYFAHKWLDDFAFKTTLSWWIFALSGVSMMIVGMLVLVLRTFRAATANPVDSLRAE